MASLIADTMPQAVKVATSAEIVTHTETIIVNPIQNFKVAHSLSVMACRMAEHISQELNKTMRALPIMSERKTMLLENR